MDKMKNVIILTPVIRRSIGYLFLLLFAFFPWIAAVLSRATNVYGGAVAGGFIGGLVGIVSGLLPGIIVFILFVPLGFFFDVLITRNYRKWHEQGKIPSWWAGGKWGVSELEK